LSTVLELRERGYQRLRISPLSSPDRGARRCALTLASNILRSNRITIAYVDLSYTL